MDIHSHHPPGDYSCRWHVRGNHSGDREGRTSHLGPAGMVRNSPRHSGRRFHRQRTGCLARWRPFTDHAATLAGEKPASRRRAAPSGGALRDGAAGPRHALPHRLRWNRDCARRIRNREDRGRAGPREICAGRYHHVHRLWGAGQRNDRSAHRVSASERPRHRLAADGADRARHQYLEHAGGGPGDLDLYGGHDGGILPRHGLRRGPDGR